MLSLIETNCHHDTTTINSKKKRCWKAGSGKETGEGVMNKKREERKIKDSESVEAKEKKTNLHITLVHFPQ